MQIRIFACRSACGNFCSVHATFFKILRENTWKLDACKYYKVFACRYWYVECMIMSIFVPCMQHFSNSTQKQVFALNRQRENKLSRRILKKAACREWKLHASISAFAAGAAAFPQPSVYIPINAETLIYSYVKLAHFVVSSVQLHSLYKLTIPPVPLSLLSIKPRLANEFGREYGRNTE